VADSRKVFYKPAIRQTEAVQLRVVPEIKATSDDLLGDPTVRLVDFRSHEEYAGAKDLDGKPGHIPGAVNILWRDVAGSPNANIFDKDRVHRLLSAAGIRPEDRIIAYCRTGPRAALGYVGLKHCGYSVRLYSGYADWVCRGLPVEV
jgi:thiosulfate/3-mercaptopyruvate sulfurtransferase